MVKHSIVLLGSSSGDWEGLYVDGRLVDEGHEIDLFTVIDELKKLFEPMFSFAAIEEPDEFFEDHGGRCPNEYPPSEEE